MSENLLFPLTVAWLLAFAQAAEHAWRPARAGWAEAFGFGAAAALWATHGRMIVAVALSAVALCAPQGGRRLPLRSPRGRGGALATGILRCALIDSYLVERNYGGRDLDEASTRLSAISNLDDLLAVAGNLVGQTWYLLVATRGLALVLPLTRAAAPRLPRSLDVAGYDSTPISVQPSSPGEERGLTCSGYACRVRSQPPLVVLGWSRAPTRARASPLVAIALAASVAVAALRRWYRPQAPSFWNVMSLPLRTDALGAASLLA